MMRLILGVLLLCSLVLRTAGEGEVSSQAFTPNEFRALYELMVQYKYGRADNCPLVIKYDAEPIAEGQDLVIRHRDMKIGNNGLENCTDVGAQRVTVPSSLTGGRLVDFSESINNNLDKRTVLEGLMRELDGRKWYVSTQDSSRTCGPNDRKWFQRSETFFYFDESETIRLTVVAKVTGGEPKLLSLPLVGNIRYMIAVTSGTTCIYRVQTDVANVILGSARPSDSPSVSPIPSNSAVPSPSASASASIPVPSSTPSASSAVIESPSPSASASPAESVSQTSSPNVSPAVSSTSSPLVAASTTAFATSSPSASLPVSAIGTRSSSPSASVSSAPSASVSSTPSASMSSTPQPTQSSTSSSTPSASTSSTPSPTQSTTPSAAASTTPTQSSPARPSATSSTTPTSSVSPTSTRSSTRSPEPSLTIPQSLPPTRTPTPSSTPSSIPPAAESSSSSPVPSSSSSPVPSSSSSPVPSSSSSPASSPASSPTSSATSSATSSPASSTASSAASVSPSSASSGSSTPSPTGQTPLAIPTTITSALPSPSSSSDTATSPGSQNAFLGSATPSTTASSQVVPLGSATPSASISARPAFGIDPGNLGSEDRNTSTIDGTSTCFPGSAMVRTQHRGIIAISKLEIGEPVWTGHEFSNVLTFTHRDADADTGFRRLCTASGCLIASHGHFVYANGVLVMAGSVDVGDLTNMGSVISVMNVRERGLYNPQTENGDIVVNGFRASCYTQRIEVCTAHALLAPVRLVGTRLPRFAELVGILVARMADSGVWGVVKGVTWNKSMQNW